MSESSIQQYRDQVVAVAVRQERESCANANRWTLQQSGRTYTGHWHGTFGICDDGSVFHAGRGWMDFAESQRIIGTTCR